jgi:hypothetical protein
MIAMTALMILWFLGLVAGTFHIFLARSIDQYTGYGQGGTFREWKDFEKQKLGF